MHGKDAGALASGRLIINGRVEYPELAIVEGEVVEWDGDRFRVEQDNGVVNTGLNLTLDRLFALGGPPAGISHIGVASNNTAVTASTAFLNGTSAGAAANTIIKAISPAAVRTGQKVVAGATFANADFTSGVFAINKVGLLNTSTDAGTGLFDVIGGSGGAAPFNKTFVVDFTAAGTFSLTVQIEVEARNS